MSKSSGSPKLNKTDVTHIKSLKGKFVGVDIAKQYDISPSTVYHIWTGKIWKNT